MSGRQLSSPDYKDRHLFPRKSFPQICEQPDPRGLYCSLAQITLPAVSLFLAILSATAQAQSKQTALTATQFEGAFRSPNFSGLSPYQPADFNAELFQFHFLLPGLPLADDSHTEDGHALAETFSAGTSTATELTHDLPSAPV